MNEVLKKFLDLCEDDKKRVHIMMAELSLKIWEEFANKQKASLKYRESVCGTMQTVNLNLPRKALQAVKNNSSGKKIANEYLEPICAMQDDDLTFEDDIEMAYYCIYNTFRKYIYNENIDDWLIINQALSSLGNNADIFTPLKQAIEKC